MTKKVEPEEEMPRLFEVLDFKVYTSFPAVESALLNLLHWFFIFC